ncbi:MAG: glycosyltransferase [Bacteroidales bacterium]|nr:glycosyltransferase [Bacteroidales bacterium]
MSGKFERILLLCAAKYSLYNSLISILELMSEDVKGYDVRNSLGAFSLKVQSQSFRFPYKIRNVLERDLLVKANSELLNEIRAYKPDVVFVYNSEYLIPETCAEIKNTAKLIFFMGDSPFFTPLNPYYLSCLNYADLILCPDTFWINQLNMLGIRQTAYFLPGIDTSSYYTLDDATDDELIESKDLIYSGSCYNNSWGYKKALLMSRFTGMNFSLYGNKSWKRWFDFFPELSSHFVESGYIPTERLNRMFNRAKIMPVDGNPAILHGFHLRLFEALGSGVLPLTEYRQDIENIVFEESVVKPPLIRDYTDARQLAEYYLSDEPERKKTIAALRSFVLEKYNPRENARRLDKLVV